MVKIIDQARRCRFCGADLTPRLTVTCPNCGRRCALDEQRCPNCGALLTSASRPRKVHPLFAPSLLGNRRLLVKLGMVFLAIVALTCLAGSLKSSTYVFHTSRARKVQLAYQDTERRTIATQYYDLRPQSMNYANYFGGRSSYWHHQRTFKSTALYYGQGTAGYHRLWKNRAAAVNRRPLAKYQFVQRVQTNRRNTITIITNHANTIKLFSDQKDPLKFLDQYDDQGRCTYPGHPDVRYYRLRVLTQY